MSISALFSDSQAKVFRWLFGEPKREAPQPIASQLQAAWIYGSVARKSDTAASEGR